MKILSRMARVEVMHQRRAQQPLQQRPRASFSLTTTGASRRSSEASISSTSASRPQGSDESKNYLEINDNIITEFREQLQQSALVSGGDDDDAGRTSRRSSIQPLVSDDSDDGDEIPFKIANVRRVQLNKWDMIALHRKDGTISTESPSGGKTPFARFIIEFVW